MPVRHPLPSLADGPLRTVQILRRQRFWNKFRHVPRTVRDSASDVCQRERGLPKSVRASGKDSADTAHGRYRCRAHAARCNSHPHRRAADPRRKQLLFVDGGDSRRAGWWRRSVRDQRPNATPAATASVQRSYNRGRGECPTQRRDERNEQGRGPRGLDGGPPGIIAVGCVLPIPRRPRTGPSRSDREQAGVSRAIGDGQ